MVLQASNIFRKGSDYKLKIKYGKWEDAQARTRESPTQRNRPNKHKPLRNSNKSKN
jgi:hypothetical protein